jgi:hypothetical protein
MLAEPAAPLLLLLLLLLWPPALLELGLLLLCVDPGKASCCAWLALLLVLYAWMGTPYECCCCCCCSQELVLLPAPV